MNNMASGMDGHASKRQRTDADGYGIHSGNRDSFEDPHKPAPSAVVHVRGLSECTIEADLVDAVQHFGPVSYVIMMPKRRQALIEFEDIGNAINLVQDTQTNPVYIGGKQAHFNFSTSQKIQRPMGMEERGNNVLLITILNPKYPINVDVMHTICSTSGTIQRIVVFKKNGVQAMVEFDTMEAARRAKQSLNGADIYSGCCTLKIDYAKPSRLNVYKNDSESWDYTNPHLGMGVKEMSPKSQPLLAEPKYGSAPTPYGHGRRSSGYGGADYGQESFDPYGRPDRYPQPPSDPYARPDRYHPPTPERYAPDPYAHDPYAQGYHDNAGPPGMMGQQGSVLMVYGLVPEKMNCIKIFNLFCLYGNVVRVKFLKSKEGVAMVQMGDNASCERVMKYLHNAFFFQSKLQLQYSKQAFLQDVPNPHDLKDETPSFMDFMGTRNNRFTNPEAAAKNRIQPPAKVLYYFNAPPNFTEEQIFELCTEKDVKPPAKTKQFPSKSEKSSTGLLEWESKGDAIEALLTVNHSEIPNPVGKYPYTLKMCFSSTPIMG